MPDPSPGPFRISVSEAERQKLKTWAALAESLGMAHEFVDALRRITERLESSPLSWGEPLYRLKFSGALVRHGIDRMLHVTFAVHEAHHVVHVTRFDLMTGYGMDTSSN